MQKLPGVEFKHCFRGDLIWQQEGYHGIKILTCQDLSICAFELQNCYFVTFDDVFGEIFNL